LKAIQGTEIKINGIPINNLRHADDTAILTENIQELQTILNAIKVGKEYSFNINISKSKLIIVTRQSHDNAIQYKQSAD